MRRSDRRTGAAPCAVALALACALSLAPAAAGGEADPPQTGLLTVREETGGREWNQIPTRSGGSGPRFANLHAVTRPGPGVAFDWAFGPGATNVFLVSLMLTNDEADLHVEVDMADRATRMDNVFFLEPFVQATPGGALVVADYCNGHLYPLDLKPFPRTWFALWEIDMPWVGTCDLQDGFGHAIIVDTPDDAIIRMAAVRQEKGELLAPQVGWAASKGEFGTAWRGAAGDTGFAFPTEKTSP